MSDCNMAPKGATARGPEEEEGALHVREGREAEAGMLCERFLSFLAT